jgi:hypothetical protein
MMAKTPFTIWLLVWLATEIVSLAACLFLFTLGLILIEYLLYPLALGITSLLAGLTAVWASNLLIRDGLQALIEPVIWRCEITAVVLSIILIGIAAAGLSVVPPIFVAISAATILAVVATFAASRLRKPPVEDPRRKWRALLWLLIALIAIPLVIFIASLFGWVGA